MKDCLLHHLPVSKMLDDDALEELERDACVPDPLRVHNHYGPACADAEAWRFTTLHSRGSEQKTLTLEQSSEMAIERTAAAIRRTKAAGADDHMSSIRFHARLTVVVGHGTLGWLLASQRRPMRE